MAASTAGFIIEMLRWDSPVAQVRVPWLAEEKVSAILVTAEIPNGITRSDSIGKVHLIAVAAFQMATA